MKNVNVIQVVSKKAPIITIDPFTRAVYVRFSSNKVAETIDDSDGGAIVNIDIDAKGDVVGVEFGKYDFQRGAAVVVEFPFDVEYRDCVAQVDFDFGR